MRKENEVHELNEMKIFSIGKIENKEETVCIKLDQKYAAGLKGVTVYHSTVTDFAKFFGLSMSQPLLFAV